MDAEQKETPYQRWYKKHAAELAEKRKKKYAEDPAYRERVKGHTAKTRAKQKQASPERPSEYTYSQNEVAEALGVSTFVLRSWRSRDYYPMPFQHGGKYYFKESQIELLKKLQEVFKESRRPDSTDLQNAVSSVYANW